MRPVKRKAWKWIFGISLAVLILLVVFTVAVWGLINIGGAIFLALMGNTAITGMPFSAFIANFVGSPMFYIYLADVVVLLCSAIMLCITRKRQTEI